MINQFIVPIKWLKITDYVNKTTVPTDFRSACAVCTDIFWKITLTNLYVIFNRFTKTLNYIVIFSIVYRSLSLSLSLSIYLCTSISLAYRFKENIIGRYVFTVFWTTIITEGSKLTVNKVSYMVSRIITSCIRQKRYIFVF